jgi:hypothetical protein
VTSVKVDAGTALAAGMVAPREYPLKLVTQAVSPSQLRAAVGRKTLVGLEPGDPLLWRDLGK